MGYVFFGTNNGSYFIQQENATNESNAQLFGMTRYEPSVSQDLSHCHHFCIESMHYEIKELHFSSVLLDDDHHFLDWTFIALLLKQNLSPL